MDAIDQALNSLSPEELNVLNSDPKMQSDFKAKYSGLNLEPTDNRSVADFGMNTLKDLGSNIAGVGAMAAKGVASIANPGVADIPSMDDIRKYPDMMKEMGKGVANAVAHPIDTAYKYPVSTLVTLGGLAGGAASAAGSMLGPEAEAGAIAKPGLMQKVFNLFKTPVPEEEMSSAVSDIQDMVKSTVNKFGEALNSQKKAVGLPVTAAEKEASVVKYGNPHNISHADILKTKEGPVFAAKEFNWEENGGDYYRLNGDPQEVMKMTNGAHPNGSSLPKATIQQLGIPIKESPYLATPKSPTDLVSTVAKFKQEAPDMSPSIRARTATALQDQINNFVDFDKKGDSMQGVLKTQYGDLGKMITNVNESLSGAKSKMADVLQTIDHISGKMDDPGQAQAFLKRIYNNPTGKNADYLNALRKIETLSGKETLDDLFDKFSSKQALDLRHPIADIVKPALQNAGNTIQAGANGLKGLGGLVAEESNRRTMQSIKDRLKNKYGN